jgi:MFS family permease
MTAPFPGAWLAWGLAAAFYAYAFFQRVAPSVMVDDLMREFALGGALLGSLSATYFYAYAAVQIPVGMLLDRLGTRRLLVGAALIAAAGSVLFALAWTFSVAGIGRALIGASVGASYVASLKIASLWFPPRMFGLMAGLTLAAGLAGAIGAQAPLALLVQAFGWRPTALAAAGLAFLLALAMLLWVRDRPAGEQAEPTAPRRGMLVDLRWIVRIRDTWLLVAFTSLLATPVLTFGGLWGVPYLIQVHGLPRPTAGLGTSVMLAAWAVGGPLAGWLSDRLRRRRSPMVGGALAMLLCWLVLAAVPAPPLWLVVAAMLLMGLAGGFMIVGFAHTRDFCGAAAAGTAMGIVNSAVLLVGAGMQTLIGHLLDLRWTGNVMAGARVYDAAAYRFAFSSFVVTSLLALASAALLRETFARPVGEGPGRG